MASIDDLQDAVFDAVSIALGLTEEKANKMLRYSMPSGESLPFEDILPDDDRCYIRLSASSLQGIGSRDRVYKNVLLQPTMLDKTVHVLDGLTANLVFYGKKAADNAQKTFVWIQEDSARERLGLVGLAVVSGNSLPVYLPELVNGKWLNRCDLEIQMYRKSEYQDLVPAINAVDINIIRG